MMESLPPDIDDTEGGFPWDFTYPTALEKDELLNFHLVETLKLMFPAWSYGAYLDGHARADGLSRRPANAAAGIVTFTGTPGTQIPEGTVVCVPSCGGVPAIEYATDSAAYIGEATDGEDGTVDVAVTAVEPGPTGNVGAGVITIMMDPIAGVTLVNNADKITGKPLKAEAKAYVADKLAALQQELYKDFVTTDQLAKADDARALATENGKTMAEKAHKLGVELVEYITKDEALQPSVFTDVKEGAYYVDAVNWAVDKKVTSGKTETTFAPNDSCTRAQAVTFLWRAAGSPEPTASEMTFTDVKADSYYYKAVLWAVENKITSGMGDTLFAPDATCSRSQIVTFLYRMQNSPESKAENPFTDVKADAYYANAVLWAVENGVTTGASATTFDPAGDCTRGQIVTFLYRCLSK